MKPSLGAVRRERLRILGLVVLWMFQEVVVPYASGRRNFEDCIVHSCFGCNLFVVQTGTLWPERIS